jgi:ribose transport system permease protein
MKANTIFRNILSSYRKLRSDQLYTMIFVAVLLFAAGQILNRNFISPANIGNIMGLAVILAFAAAGQTLVVIMGGGIDISAGSVMSLGAIIAVQVMRQNNSMILPSILIIIVSGALIGLCNAAGIIKAKVPPLVMTLAMANVVSTIQMIVSKGTPDGKPAPAISFLGTSRIFPWLPYLVLLGALLILIMYLLMYRTVFGRQFFAVGSNENAARLTGIRVTRIRTLVYVLSGVLAGMAGFWFAAYNTFININIANHYVMPAVAAVLIGGSPFSGGKGRYSGSVAGAVVLTLVSSLLIMMRTSDPVKQVINGGILLVLLALYNREPSIQQ